MFPKELLESLPYEVLDELRKTLVGVINSIPNRQLECVIAEDAKITNMVIKQPYCYVEVQYVTPVITFTGHGFSKVCYPDQWDSEEGVMKATQRAIRHIRQQIRTYVNEGI